MRVWGLSLRGPHMLSYVKVCDPIVGIQISLLIDVENCCICLAICASYKVPFQILELELRCKS